MTTKRYADGTEVVITGSADHMLDWVGMKAIVTRNGNTPDIMTFITPKSIRLDGFEYEPFFWLTKYLEEA